MIKYVAFLLYVSDMFGSPWRAHNAMRARNVSSVSKKLLCIFNGDFGNSCLNLEVHIHSMPVLAIYSKVNVGLEYRNGSLRTWLLHVATHPFLVRRDHFQDERRDARNMRRLRF